MKSKYYAVFASLVIAAMTLAPSVAQASTPGIHAHSHLVHDRTPHVHDHGSHSHHG